MKVLITFLFFTLFSAVSLGANIIEKINGFSLTKNSIQTIDIKKDHRPLVVMFISKDCPCSRGNLDYLDVLSNEFKSFHFIGIHSKKDTKSEDITSYLQDKKLSFEVFNDNDLKIADQFKALKTPHVFIVNTDGEIVYNGGVTNTTSPINAKEHFLRTALTEMHNHKLPSNSETRTLGCFITR